MFAQYLTIRNIGYAVAVFVIIAAYLLGHTRGAATVALKQEQAARTVERRVANTEVQDVSDLLQAQARIKELEQQLALQAAGDKDAGTVAINADAVQRINSQRTDSN